MNPKILKVLVVLLVVAGLKLTVLGALGLKTWNQIQEAELLPLSKALAATPAASVPAAPAAVAPGNSAAPAEPDMLAQTSIPDPNVQESSQSSSLKRREEELAAKERALLSMEKSIDDKLAQLKRAEASLKKLLDEADSLKDARIKRQVDTYMAMKPKQAAEVLSNMDQELAVKILTGMKPKAAGEIMTFVKTDKAAKLTEAMTRVQAPLQGPGQ